jgi:hypothetical protein
VFQGVRVRLPAWKADTARVDVGGRSQDLAHHEGVEACRDNGGKDVTERSTRRRA